MDIEYANSRKPTLPALPGVPRTVSATGSPFSFIASENGTVFVSAGTVSDLALARGSVSLSLGVIAGTIPMRTGDVLTITYAVAPTIRWFP